MRDFPDVLEIDWLRLAVIADPDERTTQAALADSLHEHGYGSPTQCRWAARETAKRESRRLERERIEHLVNADGMNGTVRRGRIRESVHGQAYPFDPIVVITGNHPPVVVGDVGYYLTPEGERVPENEAEAMAIATLVYVAGDRRIVVGAGWVRRNIIETPRPTIA